MSVFNPKILEASVRDVVSRLPDEQKVDVLLHAARHLRPDSSSRTLVENAVQSCLHLPSLSPANAAKARLLRVKARLNAGVHHGLHQELQTILALDPDSPDAKALLFRGRQDPHVSQTVYCKKSVGGAGGGPPLSPEVWCAILEHLPRPDLKSLLLVPHVVSRLAVKFLFREVDLHFAVPPEDEDDNAELEAWHARRAADILTRIIVDSDFAALVRTLRVHAPTSDSSRLAFHTGMLANAIPKMANLKNVLCNARHADVTAFLTLVESTTPDLESLSLHVIDQVSELRSPKLQRLRRVSYASPSTPPPAALFILPSTRAVQLYTHVPLCSLPLDILPKHLTDLRLGGPLRDPRPLAVALASCTQLRSLSLHIWPTSPLSSMFRTLLSPGSPATPLPLLSHFAFEIRYPLGSNINPATLGFDDADLFPALADLLRSRTRLVALSLVPPRSTDAQRQLGFDAAAWGVLPSLPNLRSLRMAWASSVAPQLAAWLLPRGLRSLTLVDAPRECIEQLRAGVPPNLSFVGLDGLPQASLAEAVEQGFPMVRVLGSEGWFWTVRREVNATASTGDVKLEAWSSRQCSVYARQALERYGCAEALWPRRLDFEV